MARKRKPRSLPKKHHDLGQAELDAAQKVAEAAEGTSYRELKARWGDRVIEEPDGKHFRLKLEGKRELEEYDEMDAPRTRAECAQCDLGASKIATTTLRDRDGREYPVAEHLMDFAVSKAEARGIQLHQKPRYGRPTKRWVVLDGELVRVM